MEFTQEEKKIIDRELAKADEDIKNGRIYTEEESLEFINNFIRSIKHI